MTIQYRSLARPEAQSVTLRTVLALFEADGCEATLSANLARLMVARAIVVGRR